MVGGASAGVPNAPSAKGWELSALRRRDCRPERKKKKKRSRRSADGESAGFLLRMATEPEAASG